MTEPIPKSPSALSGLRVLVVDDDPFILYRMSKFMSGSGIAVETLTDADAAVARFQDDPAAFDVVFMDMRFPQGDIGFDRARVIAGLTSDVPPFLIGMTGYGSDFVTGRTDKIGLDAVLEKPPSQDAVLAVLARRKG